jgi:hypothetical protein
MTWVNVFIYIMYPKPKGSKGGKKVKGKRTWLKSIGGAAGSQAWWLMNAQRASLVQLTCSCTKVKGTPEEKAQEGPERLRAWKEMA